MITHDFWTLWNMPNCLGSIDGKHFALRCPPNSGSLFFNYKKFFSIVLMAVCDAKYCFTHIDIGAYGSQSDGEILQVSCFGKKLLGNKLPTPQPTNLPDSPVQIPHYFVGDAAFPLATNLMRPYPVTLLQPKEENFNKRLSRARRTIENSFGILVARWRILLTTLHMLPENAEKIILACIALHNFIMLNKENEGYCPTNYVDCEDSDGQRHDGLWRTEVNTNIPSIAPSPNIHQYGGKTSTTIRNNLRDFLFQN
ncbi:uncharacterized protein LOC129943447 [Eupeodes corollae]|uniref:uncharacterized protein LOC129943447 n=1 Tax=Eupeodes corollae TaxID=290404 RepID=UPI002490B114|nr:uncharacterized protein LOC129943447 [Eupeodes corollae]